MTASLAPSKSTASSRFLLEGIFPANATTTLVVDRVAIVDEMIVRDLDLRETDDPVTTVPDREADNSGPRTSCPLPR